MATLTTPIYGLPYPDGTERVADGDNAMGALATAVEGAIGSALRHALRYERRTTGQGITPDNTEVLLTFPDVQRDDGAGWLTFAGGTCTVIKAGWIIVSAGVNWPANAAGHRQLFVKANGVVRLGIREPAPAAGGMPQSISGIFYVPAGATVEARVIQNSGGGTTTVPDERNHLGVIYLGQ